MRVFVLIDKLNWSYHSIAQSIIKYNTDKNIEFTLCPIKNNEEYIKQEQYKFDIFFVMGFQNYERINFLSLNKTVVGVHSCHSWDNKKTYPGYIIKPENKLIDYLNKFLRVNTVSQYLYQLFSGSGVEKLFYTPNGVDSNIFYPVLNKNYTDNFVVGYSGTKSHDWRKGISDFIIPAAKKSDVNIKLAMRNDGSSINMEDMPQFYNSLSCYICASSSEGFSLSVLEAAACGLPIISTKVSGCIELIKDGENGFLVDRDIDSISEKINLLKSDENLCQIISKKMRKNIEDNYCWSNQYNQWIDFLLG